MHANTGSQFRIEPGTRWADLIEDVEETLKQNRDDWYIGVDLQGRYFLSAEGLDSVWYLPEK